MGRDAPRKRDPHQHPEHLVDEPVEDTLQQMTEAPLTVLPVLDRETKSFQGAITSQEIVELITSEARGGE